MLTRALAESEEVGDLKSALDISRMLLPIEEKIADEERALQMARADEDGVGIDAMPQSALELVRAGLKNKRTIEDILTPRELGQWDILCAAMDGDLLLPPDSPRTPATPSITPFSSPIPEPRPGPQPPPGAPAPAPAQCYFCGRGAEQCTDIRDDPRWLGEHFARADVKAHLDAQRALRMTIGREDPAGRGIVKDYWR